MTVFQGSDFQAPAFQSPRSSAAQFSLPCLLAVIFAIGSFFAGQVVGLLLAISAILFGGFAFLVAFAPTLRGSAVSAFSTLAGLFAVSAAVVRLLM